MIKRFPLFQFELERVKILHYTWFAFFVTFLLWFSHVSLMPILKTYFGMTDAQSKALLMLNVALTIPARILVGTLVDRYGPRRSYSILLFVGGVFCLLFAAAQNYQQLAIMRFLLGFVGAGFVIGIRLISEWFPAREVGAAEGIYGGWGNFGAAVASITLPFLALHIFGGEEGWRYAIAIMAAIALVYSFIFYKGVRNTPEGGTYFRPAKAGGLEVSNKKDLGMYALFTLPIYLTLAFMTWRLSPAGLDILTQTQANIAYAVIIGLTIYQYQKIWDVNKHLLAPNAKPAPHGYSFKQVAILCIAYMACFGSEIAVVSMLPQFFINEYHISASVAGLTAGAFAIMNLMARPGGGMLSDAQGRRRVLMICLAGQTIGFLLMSAMGQKGLTFTWAIMAVLVTSVFVQGACGAVYSIVPLIQRRMTGQIAGLIGAYGNVGGVVFLTIFSMVSPPQQLFYVLAATSLVAFMASLFIKEPKGHMVEVHADGRVEKIAVE